MLNNSEKRNWYRKYYFNALKVNNLLNKKEKLENFKEILSFDEFKQCNNIGFYTPEGEFNYVKLK